MSIIAKAPGKLVLIGEYAVLEGAPALVTSVNRYACITIRRLVKTPNILHSPTLNMLHIPFQINDNGKIDFPQSLTPDMSKKIKFFINIMEFLLKGSIAFKNLPAVEISINTDDFYLKDTGEKLGIGSSAALTVALVYGFIHEFSSMPSIKTELLYEISSNLHYKIQRSMGSGIDIAASSFGGILEFRRIDEYQAEVQKRKKPKNFFIIPIWSGYSTSTTSMINKVRMFKKAQPILYSDIMQKLYHISQKACIVFKKEKISEFLELSDDYFSHLKILGDESRADIISDTHMKIAGFVKSAGATYKISGAGGGDIGIALTDSAEISDKVIKAVLNEGFHVLNFNFDQSGPYIKRSFN